MSSLSMTDQSFPSRTMPELTLFRADGTSSLVPHILLRELSVPFTSVVMTEGRSGYEAADGSLSNREFRDSINENGYVPTLKVGKQIISEMPAILSYLASLVPDRKLGGGSDLERAKVVEWLAWMASQVHGLGFMMVFHPNRFGSNSTLHTALEERGRQIVGESLSRIERRLASEPHPCGGLETVVDFNLILFWYWGENAQIDMTSKYPNFGKFVQKLEKKKTVQRALSSEGLSLSFT
jgi:glutathione S-transferase